MESDKSDDTSTQEEHIEDLLDIENDPDDFWDIARYTTLAMEQYYLRYILKIPCMTSEYTGIRWMREITEGHPERCRRMIRMEREDFIQLCQLLEGSYNLRPSRNMTVIEKVGIFIFTLAQGASNRHVQERFQHSGETISRIFHEVLRTVCKLAIVLIEPSDRGFEEIPSQILNNNRFMPHFKDCIGAIDGTHIDTVVPTHDQLRFIGRKGRPTQNFLVVCNFNMQFTFVLAGYEGSAHDAHVLSKAINTPNLKFPKPPPGKYYLVDAGYAHQSGYLGPYRGVRYHLQEYQQGLKEVFNKAHSSLRSVIERCFGVWKKRWDILRDMPSFAFKTQVKIVFATMALHNYIRQTTNSDRIFQKGDNNPDINVENEDPEENEVTGVAVHTTDIDMLRNQIALSLLS